MKIEKIFVINLPHRQDRKRESILEFESIKNYDYEFIDAVNWNDLSDDYLEDCVNRDYKHRTKDKRAQYGNVACGLSHLKIYDYILNNYGKGSDKAFIILEDDFHIKNPRTFLDKVNEVLTITNDWNIIYLGGLKNTNGDKREPFLPGVEKVISVWNSHAYIIKNDPDWIAGMKECAKRGYYADRALRKVARDDKTNAHRYLIAWPYEVLQRKSYSDINRIVK